MTDRTGTEGDDFFVIIPGDSSVDGGEGEDAVFIDFNLSNFDRVEGPETFTITTDAVSDAGGRIDLALTSVERVILRVTNPDLVTVDASGFSPANVSVVPTQITLFDSNSNVTGSAFRDIVRVNGSGNEVDAGDGYDLVTQGTTQGSNQYVIQGDGDAAVVLQINSDGSQSELLRARNAEQIGVFSLSSDAVGTLSVDASTSPERSRFYDSPANDRFVGSEFNDLFTTDSSSAAGNDTLTGRGGRDTYSFARSFDRLDGIIIADFRPDDAIDLNPTSPNAEFEATTFVGTSEFSGTAGEYRYFTQGGQTFVQVDVDGNGLADGTLTIANGEFELIAVNLPEDFAEPEGRDHFLVIAGYTAGDDQDEDFTGTSGADKFFASTGDDTIDGGANVDTAGVSGNRADYTVTQLSTGVFEVSGPDGTDTLTNIEYLEFDDQTIRLLPGTGVSVAFDAANASTYQTAMNAIRDFDGNALGGNGNWLLIGSFDVNGDGDIDNVLVNDAIGRFATVGTADDGLVYFGDHGWAGETRVAGIYIDPLVQSGDVEAGSDFDSQRRFQNDLEIENINRVLGSNDYDGDGIWEVYFALTDGTAYLRALMHADGNIRYANYQSEAEVIEYLNANGFGQETYGDWFSGGRSAAGSMEGVTSSQEAPLDIVASLQGASVWIGPNTDLATEFYG